MSSNTTQSRKNYFLALSRKIYLSPDESLLDDCCDFLDSIGRDISILEAMDVSGHPIHYGRREFSIPFGSRGEFGAEEENGALLDSLVEDYEFTNIRSEDKKGR